jgi:hypothetical protein
VNEIQVQKEVETEREKPPQQKESKLFQAQQELHKSTQEIHCILDLYRRRSILLEALICWELGLIMTGCGLIKARGIGFCQFHNPFFCTF